VPKLIWLRRFIVPAIILSVLFVAFVGYYLYWVPNRQRHLDDRGFRYLKTLSDQIRLTLNTYDKMLDNAVDGGVSEDNLQDYLGNVAPQLVAQERSDVDHIIGGDYDDPPKIAIVADEGTHFLYLAFRRNRKHERPRNKPVAYAIRTDLDKLIDGLLGPPDISPFDVVLVAQRSGKVIFQKSLSGIEVAQIKNLDDASGEVKGQATQIDVGMLLPASRLEEVKIAGARYRLYSQPLQIGFLPANPKTDTAKNKPAAAQEGPKANGDAQNSEGKTAEDDSSTWVLCGLVRADRFRSQSQLIPYVYILTLLAVLLLAAVNYPFIRIYLSSPGERLRARDVTITAVFACIVTAVLTFILVDIYYWNYRFGPDADAEMAKLACAIKRNSEGEMIAAFTQLDDLDKDRIEALHKVSASLGPDSDVRVQYSGSHAGTCKPSEACRANLLEDEASFQKYPYLFFVAWNDSKGKQLMKWTTRSRPTPFIPLDDPSVPYFPEVRRAFKDRAEPRTVPRKGIGSQYSPTTGQNITIFWKIIPDISEEDESKNVVVPADKEAFCASLVTQPISLFNSVLPGGFQFAVLTPDGSVVFHSDPTRNLRENFFAETDQNPNLRSRVRMRAEGPVTADYMGHPRRMYVLPMDAANQDGQWTIVVMRDLHLEEVMNLEILSLVSIMFLLYVGAIAVVLVLAYWIGIGQPARIWLWPDSRKAKTYAWIVMANVVAVVLLTAFTRYVTPLVLLRRATFIPAAILFLNLAVLGGRKDSQRSVDQSNSTRWQWTYFGACATLLVAVVVLPCLFFFQAASNFEYKLFVEHTQMQLVADLEQRTLRMQSLYQDVSLGEHQREVFAPPENQHAVELFDPSEEQAGSTGEPTRCRTLRSSEESNQHAVELFDPVKNRPVYSYHEILDTSFCRGDSRSGVLTGDSDLALPDCKGGANPDKNPFLRWISYPYNERAADDRHLAEDKSDLWVWSVKPTGQKGMLQLTMQEREPPVAQAQGTLLKLRVASFWRGFQLPWHDWKWCLGVVVFLAAIYWAVRVNLSRMFLVGLVAPPPAKAFSSGLSPYNLMADLPVNLLIIGPESSKTIEHLLQRDDVQVHETEELLGPIVAVVKVTDGVEASTTLGDQIDRIVRDGRSLVLRNFDCVPDDAGSCAKAYSALIRVHSALGNSIIILSDIDPLLKPSIESSERWRILLRSFVRVEVNPRLPQRVNEDDADYQNRVTAEAYYRWLMSDLSNAEKLVMIQLAQEGVVNPNSEDTVSALMERGMIERRSGLLTVTHIDFGQFLKRAIPGDTVKRWEKQIAGARPPSLQTSLLVLGVGVVAFLVYTQGEVFNTWVTYATGFAASVPKVLQLFRSFRTTDGATS
jgi:hypothetical protein